MSPASPGPGGSGRPREGERRLWLALGVAMAAATVIVLVAARGTTFWGDELAWLIESPTLGVGDALRPYNGHLLLTTRLVYKVMLAAFGDGYLQFRLLTLAANLVTVTLLFVYLGRRVGSLLALAPCLVLLVFGSDPLHLLMGNGFTVLLSVACGLAALLAVEREDRLGDALACALLCLGVLTYTDALPFLLGAAVFVALGRDRWRRAWVVAVPAAVYVAWWLWATAKGFGNGDQTSLIQVLVTPSWAFQTLSRTLGSLSGLNYAFSGAAKPLLAKPGPVLAMAAIAAVWWRLRRGSVTRGLWTALAILLGLWLLGTVSGGLQSSRSPEESRYLYPAAVAVFLVAANAVAGLRLPRGTTVAVFAFTAAALGANLVLVRDYGRDLRDPYTVQTRAALGAVELAGREHVHDFQPPAPASPVELPIAGIVSPLTLPFSEIAPREPAAPAYLAAAERYGRLGYSGAELEAQGEAARAEADNVLIAALGLTLEPAPGAVSGSGCRQAAFSPTAGAAAPLPRGGAVLKTSSSGSEIQLRRFATASAVGIGNLIGGSPARLAVPVDDAATPWWVHAPNSRLLVCPLR